MRLRFHPAVVLLGVVGAVMSPGRAAAQCCVVGVPNLPTQSSDALPVAAGRWQVAVVTRLADSRQVLEGRTETTSPLSHKRTSLAVLARLEYALSDLLAIQAILPYVWERTVTAGFPSVRSRLGDVNLMAQAALMQAPSSAWRIRVGTGLSVPVDPYLDSRLGSDPNQSSGTYDPLLSASVLRFTGIGTAIDARVSYRYVSGEDPNGRRLGDVLQVSAGRAWGVRASSLPLRLGLAVLHRQRDVQNGAEDRNSGGLWVYLTPSIGWDVTGDGPAGLQLSLAGELPVYRYVNGLQLTEGFAVILGMSWGS